MAVEGAAVHSKIPRGLSTFRNKEAKALAVSLVMCGIMLLMAVIPITRVSDSSLIRSGFPVVTSLMFTLSGTLTILTEQRPRRPLGLSATVALLLSGVTGAAEAVVALVDIARLKWVPVPCEDSLVNIQCRRSTIGQATLLSSVPAVYLLTLYGSLLCVVLSTMFFEFLRNWEPDSDETRRPAASPDATSLVVEASGTDSPGDPQVRGGVRAAQPSRDVVRGERFLESEPKLLGVVLLTASFGLILLTMPDLVLKRIEMLHVGLVWWSFVQSVVAGLLAIIAAGNPSLALIRSCFALSVMSAIVSSIVSVTYMGLNFLIIICYIHECEDTIIFTQHIFPFLLLILNIILCSVLAAYARKSLRPLSLDKATLIVNPTPVQEQSEPPALQE